MTMLSLGIGRTLAADVAQVADYRSRETASAVGRAELDQPPVPVVTPDDPEGAIQSIVVDDTGATRTEAAHRRDASIPRP
jgi:hypothetical protein